MTRTAGALAERLGGRLEGADRPYSTVGPIGSAGPDAVAYAEGEVPEACTAGIVLVTVPVEGRSCIIVDDPKGAFIRVMGELFPVEHRPGIHPTAVIDPTASVDPSAWIHPFVVVGPDCEVGAHTVLFPHVVLYAGTRVGSNCCIHAGCVLGAPGLSIHPTQEGAIRVPQVGHVVVEDDVEIGPGCCIDRAFLTQTVVGAGSTLDNLVHVGHNARVGRHVIVAAQTGLSGSVTVGDGAIIGGQVGVVEHVRIGARARIGAQSGVGKDVDAGSEVLGTPALPAARMRRVYAALKHLPEWFKRA